MTMLDRIFGRKRETEGIKQDLDVRIAPSAEVERGELQTPAIDTVRLESQIEGLGQQITELMDRAEVLQEQLDRLDQRTSFGDEQIETLTRHLSGVADWAGPLDRRLAELVTWAEESREELSQLQEGIRKLSRTQFKTNSLTEAQQERLQSALETLQDLATRKRKAAEKSQQRQREAEEAARREARLSMVTDLFPALDGLESALESGRMLLGQVRQPATKPGFLARLAYAFGLRELPTSTGDIQALVAWLDGLELVRERFMALLRSEGIEPIRAEGQLFDPHWHVAVEAVERLDVPPGTVIEEHRPGYRLGDRVLRYAEVVVTRDEVVVPPPSLEAPLSMRPPWDDEPVAEEEGPPLVVWDDRAEAIDVTEEGEMAEPMESVPERIPEPIVEPVLPDMTGAEGSEADRSFLDQGGEPVTSADSVPSLDEARPEPRAAPIEPDAPTVNAKGDGHELDPEIEELLARFEERQRVHRSDG